MSVRIQSVTPGSPAALAGIQAGDRIISINGEPVVDEIDYQALSSARRLTVETESANGLRSYQVSKRDWDPLGLCLDERETMKPRHCRNRCLFCFVDQLPQGLRPSLYVKDDDWRLSLMMGNYVTLTNVNDQEFARILARRASPLYISVHATDPAVRCRMLSNPSAGSLMQRLRALKENGLEFHAQVVLCPGVNDGAVLDRTIEDLASLYPASRSMAIVPVGLTGHREGLPALRGFDRASAEALLKQVEAYQQRFLTELSTRFVFPSDEFYCMSRRPLPTDEAYEDYPQIENGVGMLRQLERECQEAFEDLMADAPPKRPAPRKLLIPTGVSARPYIERLTRIYAPEGTTVRVLAVPNRFFGETITVTGLIVGRDLIHALKNEEGDAVLLCDTMLRDRTDTFLDDMTLKDVQEALRKPLRVVENNGASLIQALWE